MGLVVVSNRLPVQRSGTRWTLSSGGLVTALRPVVGRRPTRWVGWDGGSQSLPTTLPDTEVELAPVSLSRADVRDYYDGFANATLWPLFHDLVGTPTFDRSWWEAYERTNRAFAEATTAAAEDLERPVVWVHDYHLMLVPGLLREAGAADVRFFLHIPWPAPELFARLPWREQLLRGLLGADRLSFHTERYRKNFARSCGRILPDEVTVRGNAIEYDGRVVRTVANPIAIDTDEFASAAVSPAVDRRLARLRKQFGERAVLLGVDRLDYTKGIPERLEAFERLLERREDLQGRIALAQIAIPSRGNVAQYRALREHVEQLIGRINGRFTRPGSDVPVHYLHRGVPREDLLAYYRLADLMLVTPLEDGMNLVAKEFVVVQHAGAGSGALVLSEFTGAATELTAAFSCNPFDVEGVSRVLETAYESDPQDRRDRLARLSRRVHRHDIHRWAGIELAE
ncbi:MAG: alpha,alpha-trehalose-phosphate synthase (UDP-forming) [Nocardioidaceae bacterium]